MIGKLTVLEALVAALLVMGAGGASLAATPAATAHASPVEAMVLTQGPHDLRVLHATHLTGQQVAEYAYNAGFQGRDLDVAVAIARAESWGWDPDAYGDETIGGSKGLWQIYGPAHPEFACWNLDDPQANANAAYLVYKAAGYSFMPWTTYRTGAYLPVVHYNLGSSAAPASASASKPTPAPAPTPIPSPTAQAGVYVVQPGDCLSKIAAEHSTTWQAIYAIPANRAVIGNNPSLIRPGQRLVLPGAVRATITVPAQPAHQQVHIIQPGETLAGIAAQFHTTVAHLAAINHISNPDQIIAGHTLIVD